jgi:hypothetical protein
MLLFIIYYIDESAQQIFRPKAFRHLHSVISTGIDFVDGVIPFRGIMLNSPEPYVMNNVKKSIDAKTPLAILYKSKGLMVSNTTLE